MAIYNLGSINVDLFYRVPHLPAPGETLAAHELTTGLGGKGANMSVAAARGGARVCHIGAVGNDGAWAVDRLLEYGVDTRHIATIDAPTGQAVIAVDDTGENSIIILPGANRQIAEDAIRAALSEASVGDTLLLQNETNAQAFAAELGHDLGLRVAYAAAPFSADAVEKVLPFLELLILNEVEAAQLEKALGKPPKDLPVRHVVVTRGGDGSVIFDNTSGDRRDFPALPAKVVDTTGAGDTFSGYLLAAMDRALPIPQAMQLATRAGALMVSRHGTADVIPDLEEVQDARF